MGQVVAKIRKLISDIVARFFSKSGNKETNATGEQISPDQVEELRERLVTITEDAYIITIGEEDQGQERISHEIVEDKQHLDEIIPVPVQEQFDLGRERLVTIAEDAYIITIGEEDQGQERISDEIVEDKQHLDEIIPVPVQEQFDLGSTSEVSTWVGVVLRTPQPLPKEKPKWIKHYCSSHKILLVGEGDFSFSACLAKAFGSAINMVATSLDSLDFLQTNYAKAMSNINYMKNRGCTVRHDFDATAMYNNRHLLNYDSPGFDRIVYNFPLAGFFKDQSSERQLKRNRHLVRSFLANARKMLPDDGEIHITHKSNGFFLKWDLEDLATKCGLRLIEQVMFNLSEYPGYHTKYGFGGDNNFNCKPSKTYKFGHQ